MGTSQISEDFIDILKLAQAKESIVSIYVDPEDVDHFDLGVPRCLSAEEVILEAYDQHGHFDGYYLLFLEDIFRIDHGGRYEHKVDILRESKHEKSPAIDSLSFIDGSKSLISPILQFAIEKKYVVEIAQDSWGVIDAQGFVKRVSPTSVEIDVLTNYGEDDGVSHVEFSSISELYVNTVTCRELAYLASCFNKSG